MSYYCFLFVKALLVSMLDLTAAAKRTRTARHFFAGVPQGLRASFSSSRPKTQSDIGLGKINQNSVTS